MSGPLLCLTDVTSSFSIGAGTATSVDDKSFPASNVLDYTHPLRELRTANTSSNANQVVLTNTSGSAITIGGVFVDNFNWTTYSVEFNSTTISGFSQVDPRNGRPKFFVRTATDNIIANNGSIVIEKPLGNSTHDGSSLFKVGGVSVWAESGLRTLPGRDPQDVNWTITLPQIEVSGQSSSPEIVDVGVPYVTANFKQISYLHQYSEPEDTENQSDVIHEIYRRGSLPLIYVEQPDDLYYKGHFSYCMRVKNLSSGVTTTNKLIDLVTDMPLSLVETL